MKNHIFRRSFRQILTFSEGLFAQILTFSEGVLLSLMNRELLSKIPFTLHQSALNPYILTTYTGEGLF